MITNDCKGCLSYDLDNDDCSMIEVGGICPCSVCLIKGICTDPCIEFAKYGGDTIYED